MKRTDVKKLVSLQQNAANIRNVCILAHVDHGDRHTLLCFRCVQLEYLTLIDTA